MNSLRIVGFALTPFILAVGSTRAAPPAYRPVNGVFFLGTPDTSIPAAALKNPHIDGIALRATWKAIEPASGDRDWSYFDSQIAAAAAVGKRVSLSVTAGDVTPAWVFAGGAKAFTYIDTQNKRHTIPVPWDAVFLARWQRFIQALGNRYANNPTVVLVKITGINADTPETMLPRSADDTANWRKNGYTRQKVEDAWQSTADSFSKSFPRIRIALIVVPNGFPPIDRNGQIMQGAKADDLVVTSLIQRGIARYGDHFAVENHGLSDFWVSQQVARVASKVTTGYQMLWLVTGDASGRMHKDVVPADANAVLQEAVNKGIAAGGRYLEVYEADVVNSKMQDILAAARTRLR